MFREAGTGSKSVRHGELIIKAKRAKAKKLDSVDTIRIVTHVTYQTVLTTNISRPYTAGSIASKVSLF
jgi:hypothetical protein